MVSEEHGRSSSRYSRRAKGRHARVRSGSGAKVNTLRDTTSCRKHPANKRGNYARTWGDMTDKTEIRTSRGSAEMEKVASIEYTLELISRARILFPSRSRRFSTSFTLSSQQRSCLTSNNIRVREGTALS